MNTTDELATRISKGDVAVLQTSDLDLFWHESCRYKVWAGEKVPPCVSSECDFHANWLHVSRIRPTHWRLNDDFDINQWHRRLVVARRHRGVSVCVVDSVLTWKVSWLSWLAVLTLTFTTLIFYLVPLRWTILVWGLVKFTAKLRRPDAVHHIGLLNFLTRVPSNRQLVRSLTRLQRVLKVTPIRWDAQTVYSTFLPL